MMEAVARRKAHWLFGSGSEKNFIGKRRPQEDMVTSAVFGSIGLLSPKDRCKAIEILLGRDAFNTTGLSKNCDIGTELWPRLTSLEGRRHVEPDVLLRSADKTTIVEVKWHAPLSKRQLEQQVEAVGAENVSAVVLLGEAGVGENISGTPCFRRTWRDVSGDLQNWQDQKSSALSLWGKTMQAFLQETDMGRIFNGLPIPRKAKKVSYSFRKPGHRPWLEPWPNKVETVQYTFKRGV
ncbi:hypothetical protein [Neptunicoccus cionae]|uniref:hypothetical protein n=1 Tax=Neptunicoccus cionae TaxID=2035344 RepID=UPI000C77E9A9|nr:hypothetical protein [Amylibacter cionae]PLS21966.1 hypothetical protein C0U40_05860 [Amylibacter cionae]